MHRFKESQPLQVRSQGAGWTSRAPQYAGSLTGGGLRNPNSGMGTGLDRSDRSYFAPTIIRTRSPLEVLCVESWVARKAVSMPIVQMFLRWRSWQHNPEEPGDVAGRPVAEIMQEAERQHRVLPRLAKAMQAGRQYGTGFLLLVTREAPLTEPLVVERIREGDLVSVLPLDRYEVSVRSWNYSLESPDVMMPAMYYVHPSRSLGSFECHPSRMLRFDGLTAANITGFQSYDADWGVSILIPMISSLMQEAGLPQTVDHLTHEASVPVLEVAGLRDALSSSYNMDSDEPSPEQIASQINAMKSNYRLLMLEKGEETFNRIPVNFAGLAELMDRAARRVSAAAEMPMTVMFSTSPIGLNATGEHDAINWAIGMESTRKSLLDQPLRTLDAVLARDIGLREAPPYKWLSILDMSDAAEADIAFKRVQAIQAALTANLMDETEGRRILDGDSFFGSLPGAPPPPDFLGDPGNTPFS